MITYDATFFKTQDSIKNTILFSKKNYIINAGTKVGIKPMMAMMVMVRVAKLLEYIMAEAVGDKRRPGNLPIVGYRHPEVALIEIMIGELM